MFKIHCVLASAILLSLFVSPASAVLLTVTNPSFEDDAATAGSYIDANPNGWSFHRNTGGLGIGYANPNSAPDGPAAVGTNFGYVYSQAAGTAATLYQQVSGSFAPNTTYTLSVLVGDAIRNNGSSGYIFPSTMRIGIYNSTTGSAGQLVDDVATTLVSSPGDGLAAYETVTFTTTSTVPTGPIVIGMSSINIDQSSNVYLATLDDITFDATLVTTPNAVPEPSSMLLMLTGTALLVRRRRQFCRSNSRA